MIEDNQDFFVIESISKSICLMNSKITEMDTNAISTKEKKELIKELYWQEWVSDISVDAISPSTLKSLILSEIIITIKNLIL